MLSALNSAVRTGKLVTNPATFVDLPQVKPVRRAVWSPEEFRRFVDGTAGDPLHALYVLLGMRGLRRGEALALRWVDIDLGTRQIRVDRQASYFDGEHNYGPPKSRFGVRTVAIDVWLAKILEQHQRQQQSDRKSRDQSWSPEGLVFTEPDGKALNPIQVTRQFDRLIKKVGLPRIRLHDLRHTSASIGLASGETLLEVSRRLGHSSITITGDIYSEVSEDMARVSADQMSTYMFAKK